MTWLRRPCVRQILSVAFSVGVHLSAYTYLAGLGAPPLEIDFEWPDEVEFGLAEEAVLARTKPEAVERTEALPQEAVQNQVASAANSNPPDAGIQPDEPVRPADAGLPTPDDGSTGADPTADASRRPDADASSSEASDPEGGEYTLPPGAQIALRLDMKALSTSPFAADVRALLDEIPDWHAILAGSGIRPMDDLERLMIASPDFRDRARLVIAGRHAGGPAEVRRVVRTLAAARGLAAPWTRSHGVPVAPWIDEDATQRAVALVGPSHFVIAPRDEIGAVLDVARARHQRHRDAGAQANAQALESGLLAMEPGDTLTVDIEGAERYLRARSPAAASAIANRLRLGLAITADATVALSATGSYRSAQEAENALAFWQQVAEAYGRRPLLRLMNLAAPISQGTFTADGNQIRFSTTLTAAQVRLLMELGRPYLGIRPPPTAPR